MGAKASLAALVNMAADEELVTQMSNLELPGTLAEMIRGEEVTMEEQELCGMILQNVTRTEVGAISLLQCDKGALQYSNMMRLVKLLSDAPDTKHHHPLYRIATVLQNTTQVPPGRQFLLDKNRDVIKHLLVPLCSHTHPLVQSGIFGAIRNCMVDDSLHKWLLEETEILGLLMRPLRLLLPDFKKNRGTHQQEEDEDEDDDLPPLLDKTGNVVEQGGKANEDVMLVWKHVVEALALLGKLEENQAIICTKKHEIHPLLEDLDKS